MNTSPAPVSGASMDGHSPLLNSQTTKPNISFMNVLWINQEVTLPLTKSEIDKQVEAAEIMGRVCYKSEPKGDPIAFLSRIINRGHESVIEHINIPAVLSTDRAVTHQLVRHRHMSVSMESQRFVNYSRKGIIASSVRSSLATRRLTRRPLKSLRIPARTLRRSTWNLSKEDCLPKKRGDCFRTVRLR